MDYEVMDFFRSKVSTSVRRKQSRKSTLMNIRTKLNHFQNQALYSHQFNMTSDEYQNKVEPLSEPSTVQPSIQYDPKCGNPDEFECVMDKPSIPEVSLPCSSLDTSFECNMMHCESESCYSSHCNVKYGDFELEDYDYDLDYDGIYNYPEYDDYYDKVCSPP